MTHSASLGQQDPPPAKDYVVNEPAAFRHSEDRGA